MSISIMVPMTVTMTVTMTVVVVDTEQGLPTIVSQAVDAIIEHQGAAEQTEVSPLPLLLLPLQY